MNIKELEQAVKQTKEEMEAERIKYKKIQYDLKQSGWRFRDIEFKYEQLIEQLYEAQQQEIAERGVK